MKRFSDETKRIMWLITFAAALFVIAINFKYAFGIVKLLFNAALPITFGLALAFILNVPLSFFERRVFGFMDNSKHKSIKKLKKPLCLIITLLLVLLFIALVISIILPTFIDAVKGLIESISDYAKQIPDWLSSLAAKFDISTEKIKQYTMDRSQFLDSMVKYLRTKVSSVVAQTASFTLSVVSTLTTGFLSLIVAIYALCYKEKTLKFINRLLTNFTGDSFAKKIRKVADVAYHAFSGFISGQFIDSIVLGLLSYIGMTLFRLPYAGVVSVIVGVAQLIPIVGGFASAAIGSLLLLTVSPIKAITFLILIIVTQQLEGNLIYPKIVGKHVGLPGILVISSVIIGGNLFGIPGVLIGIPLMSTCYALVKLSMDERESKVKKTTDTDQ